MNAEKLLYISNIIKSEFERTNIHGYIDQLIQMLHQLNGNNHPSHAQQVTNILQNIANTIKNGNYNNLGNSDREMISEIGYTKYIDPILGSVLFDIVNSNSITISNAINEISTNYGDSTQKYQIIANLSNSLNSLGFEEYAVVENPELYILIPRDFTNQSLHSINDELKKIEFILNPFFEIAGLDGDDIKVNSISSSEYLFFIAIPYAVTKILSLTLSQIKILIDKYSEIRKSISILKQQGIKDDIILNILEQMRDESKKIAETTASAICPNQSEEKIGRPNELQAHLRKSILKIIDNIDKGFVFEINLPSNQSNNSKNEIDEESFEQLKNECKINKIPKLDAKESIRILENIFDEDNA